MSFSTTQFRSDIENRSGNYYKPSVTALGTLRPGRPLSFAALLTVVRGAPQVTAIRLKIRRTFYIFRGCIFYFFNVRVETHLIWTSFGIGTEFQFALTVCLKHISG